MNDLDKLTAEYEGIEEDFIDTASQEEEAAFEEEEAFEEEIQEEIDEKPPGFIDNIEDWLAAGKNPDDFKGKNAYKAEYDRIQEVKELKAAQKVMNNTLKSTLDAVTARDAKIEERHKRELESALAQAKEDGDTDAALQAQEDLHSLKTTPPIATERQVNPIITDFLDNNPALKSQEMNDEFKRVYHGRLRADGVAPDQVLSEAALSGYLNASLESVKSLYSDKFVSPRNARQTMKRPNKAPKAKVSNDDTQGLKNYKVEGASGRNSQAALDIYKMLKKTAPEQAEIYKKQLLGEG